MACLSKGICGQKEHHYKLRNDYDQKRYKRAAERACKQQVHTGPQAGKVRNVLDQHNNEQAAEHDHDAAQPPNKLRFCRRNQFLLPHLSVQLNAAVDEEEQEIEWQIHEELPPPVAAERPKQRPYKTEVEPVQGTERPCISVYRRDKYQREQRGLTNHTPWKLIRRLFVRQTKVVQRRTHPFPRSALIPAPEHKERNDREEKEPCDDAVADCHLENIFRHRHQPVSQLRDERDTKRR